MFGLLVLLAGVAFLGNFIKSKGTEKILFPTENVTLYTGQKYNLRWVASFPDQKIAIFLIDSALEKVGTSVSIVDRVYDVPNSGNFDYIVPENLDTGKYRVTIGDLNSNYFNIVKMNSTDCRTTDIKGTVSFEGAAGSLYGNFEVKNISAKTCTLDGSKTVTLLYAPNIKNISISLEDTSKIGTIELKPNETIYARAQIQNGPQCSSGINPLGVNYAYPLDGSAIAFEDMSGNMNFSINICRGESEITKVNISGFTRSISK